MFSVVSNVESISEQVYDSIISSVTKVINREVQNCASYTQNDQVIEVGGTDITITGSIVQNQRVQVNINCVQKVNITTDIVDKIMSDIKQNIETKFADSAGFNVVNKNGSYQSAMVSIRTELTNIITNETLQDCSNKINQLQIFKIDPDASNVNISGQILQTQTYNAYANCLQQKIANTNIKNTIENLVSQISKFEQDSFMKSLTYLLIVIAIILAIVGGMYLASIYFKSKTGRGEIVERKGLMDGVY